MLNYFKNRFNWEYFFIGVLAGLAGVLCNNQYTSWTQRFEFDGSVTLIVSITFGMIFSHPKNED